LSLLLAAAAPVATSMPLPVQSTMQQTWFQEHVGWLTHGIAGIFIISAIALVALLAVQTTKQEGLSGTIGGRVESAYGRMGADEQLKRVTGFTAVLFVLTGFVLSLTGI
jgi:preprotein translocase subunit SecG